MSRRPTAPPVSIAQRVLSGRRASHRPRGLRSATFVPVGTVRCRAGSSPRGFRACNHPESRVTRTPRPSLSVQRCVEQDRRPGSSEHATSDPVWVARCRAGLSPPWNPSVCRVRPCPFGTVSRVPSPHEFHACCVRPFEDSVVSPVPLAPGVPSGTRSILLGRHGVGMDRSFAGSERAACAPIGTTQNNTARRLRAPRAPHRSLTGRHGAVGPTFHSPCSARDAPVLSDGACLSGPTAPRIASAPSVRPCQHGGVSHDLPLRSYRVRRVHPFLEGTASCGSAASQV